MTYFLKLIPTILVDITLLIYLGKVYNFPWGIDKIRFISIFIMIVLLFINLILNYKKKLSNIFLSFTFYSIYILLILLIRNQINITSLMTTLLFPIVFLFSYSYNWDKNAFNKVMNFQFYFLWLLTILYLYTKFYVHHSGGLMVNSVYYIVFLLPYIYSLKSKTKKCIGKYIILIVSLLSMKRTAIIITVGSIIIELFLYWNSLKKEIIKRYFKITLFILILCIIVFSLETNMNFNILDRFSNILDDGGSGRMTIYQMVIDGLLSGTVTNFLFGNGFNAAISVTSGYSAHNDSLEIFYNFGFFGYILYFNIIYILIKYGYVLKKKKNNYYLAYVISIYIFVVMGLFSNVIFVPTYVILLSLFWALCIKNYKSKRKEVLI